MPNRPHAGAPIRHLDGVFLLANRANGWQVLAGIRWMRGHVWEAEWVTS